MEEEEEEGEEGQGEGQTREETDGGEQSWRESLPSLAYFGVAWRSCRGRITYGTDGAGWCWKQMKRLHLDAETFDLHADGDRLYLPGSHRHLDVRIVGELDTFSSERARAEAC